MGATPARAVTFGNTSARMMTLLFRVGCCYSIGRKPFMKIVSIHSTQDHQARRSACADRSSASEWERLRSMSVYERTKLALTMGERFAWLQPKRRDP